MLNRNISISEIGYISIFYILIHTIINALIASTTSKFLIDDILGFFFAPFLASFISILTFRILISIFNIKKIHLFFSIIYTLLLLEGIFNLFTDDTFISIMINDIPYKYFYNNLPNIFLIYNNYISLFISIIIVQKITTKMENKKIS